MSGKKTRALRLLVLAGACGLSVLCGAASAAKAAPSAQEALTELGTLTCSLTSATGAADPNTTGQGRDVLCRFRPGLQGAEETYVGTLQGAGQVAALFSKGTIMLAVKGPAATELASGLLEQTYAADASTAGGAAAPLIGDRNRRIVLQPMAEVEGRVAAGKSQPDAVIVLVELKLKSSPA